MIPSNLPSETTTDQALPGDLPPLPGTPFGIVLVGALGWLSALCGLILLPWPFPGATPAPIGSHLLRFTISIPGESIPAAILRHGLDVLPYVIAVMVPLSLVIAMGWRRPRSAVKALTILGVLGIAYSIGAALQFGPMLFVIGCVLITVCGWLGWSLPIVPFDDSAFTQPIDQPDDQPGAPMAVPFDAEAYRPETTPDPPRPAASAIDPSSAR